MGIGSVYKYKLSEGVITPDQGQADVVERLAALSDLLDGYRGGGGSWMFRRRRPPKGIYLWGGVGRGKSMLMDLFYEAAPVKRKRRVHFHAFMQEVHTGMTTARKSGVKDPLAPVAKKLIEDATLLCFDELQITDITDAMLVGRLFEFLFESGVVIVATSNRPPKDLYKDGLNRNLFTPFIDLIEQKLDVHEIATVTDFRQNRLLGEARYFAPLSNENQAVFDALWLDLAGGQITPMVLVNKKRDIHIPQTGNGVARFSFDDLCEKPLGASDYLVIAEQFRMIFIEGIPVLSKEMNNQAKRFVTLIDALYEARSQLIILADALPDALYKKGAGAFEFERTASRLNEMMSADWPPEN